jgi:ligand-binding SRPBCC domain-containing protein
MINLHLTTIIEAPPSRVFDLSRSINLNTIAHQSFQQKAIAGTTTGLINLNESVTWQAKHFFKLRKFTTTLTQMDEPNSFTTEMKKGDFKKYQHQHFFKPIKNGTIMIDIVELKMPYGALGNFIGKLFLKSKLQKILLHKNKVIKQYAETNKWKLILN